jgi:hypothetical protein
LKLSGNREAGKDNRESARKSESLAASLDHAVAALHTARFNCRPEVSLLTLT